ncbi:MAG: shikimate kinase [Smithella sp.]|jgi:shikimate kinase
MKVVLIGYRATGKSTVGRILSAKLKIAFWDADAMLEKSMAMPVKEIVALHGWDFFRAKEKETIKTLAQKGACVIATGGGVVLAQENVDLLKQVGVIIWLNAPLQDIVDRLNKDAQSAAIRPQFTAGNIVQETVDMMKQRILLYENAADHTVDTASKSAVQVAEEIYQYLRKSGNLAKINPAIGNPRG